MALLSHQPSNILIVGAGSSGLLLALLLQKSGQNFQIIEKKPAPDGLSKATGVHANSLKLLDKIDLADEIGSHAIELLVNNFVVDGTFEKKILFPQGKGKNDKNLSISQNTVEDIFVQTLKKDGVTIDYNSTLTHFQNDSDGVQAIIETDNAAYTRRFDFLIGCDGASSTVRKILNINFPGETTPEWSFTFDAQILSEPLRPQEMYTYTTKNERLVVVPIPGDRLYKFSGRISDDLHAKFAQEDLEAKRAELAELVFKRSGIEIDLQTLSGLCFYHTQSRLASSMHEKRVFLVGDAAHLFFPAGGYGLNTALEDAYALAWRLACSKTEWIKQDVFSSYNTSRLSNAKLLRGDSGKKREEAFALNTIGPKEKQEKQAYQQSHSSSSHSYFRFHTMFDEDYLSAVVSGTETLAEAIGKRYGFVLIVNTEHKELLSHITQLCEKTSFPLPFRMIHVSQSLESKNRFVLPNQDSFFTKNPERLIFITPDNFSYLIQSPLSLNHL
ncbi:MAG: FAD-dependent monooxygenase [Chlamydiia bacterium]|nr:FAD-dependent monooxygenase [Chlamydiia bacterium]